MGCRVPPGMMTKDGVRIKEVEEDEGLKAAALEMGEMLLKKGAEVDKRDFHEHTALWLACQKVSFLPHSLTRKASWKTGKNSIFAGLPTLPAASTRRQAKLTHTLSPGKRTLHIPPPHPLRSAVPHSRLRPDLPRGCNRRRLHPLHRLSPLSGRRHPRREQGMEQQYRVAPGAGGAGEYDWYAGLFDQGGRGG